MEKTTLASFLKWKKYTNDFVLLIFNSSDFLSSRCLGNSYFSVTLKNMHQLHFSRKKVQLHFSVRNVQLIAVAPFFNGFAK
jgi:hypothetical protein